MTSPAERYAAARRRGAHPALAEFAGQYSFPLDPFQVEACRALEDGSGVLVCASTVDGLGFVVMDEVHYLADRFRGAVWEEVIIHLPRSVTLVSLSATVSNAEEFADWLVTVRGDTRAIVTEHRPVPLWQHMLVGKRLFDLLRDTGDGTPGQKVDAELARFV